MGGLYYNTTKPVVLIGSKDSSDTRTKVTLKTSYQTDEANEAVSSIPTGGYSKIALDVLYTMGGSETGNSIEMIAEGSPDRTNWYRLSADSTSSGTSTLTQREWTFVGNDADDATISIFLDIGYKYMRFSFKETGVASNAGSIFVEATLSGM